MAFKLTLEIEDFEVVASSDFGHEWEVTFKDISGLPKAAAPEMRVLTEVQLGAICALAIGAESGSPVDEVAYPIAEEACEGLPRDLRPMP